MDSGGGAMSAATSDARETRLRQAQLQLLFGQTWATLPASLLVALLLVGGLWPVVDHTVALAWLVAMTAVVALRGSISIHYRRHPPAVSDLDAWWHRFFCAVLLAGLAWGSAAIVLFPAGEVVHQAYLGLVFAGLCAGAISSLSAARKIVLAFVLPLLLPLAVQFLASGNRMGLFFGATTLLFLVFILFSSRRIGATLKDNQLLQIEVEERGARIAASMAELSAVLDSVESSERKFRCLVERSLAGVYIIDGGRFSYVNPILAEIFGYTQEELIGRLGPLELTYEPDRETVRENMRRRAVGEVPALRYQFRGLRKDGEVIHVEVLGTRAMIDGRDVVIGTLLDITDTTLKQRRIEELAHYDELTGLANRRMLMEAARVAVEAAQRRGEPLCVIYLDLDRFKNVNDTLGHDAGDQLLVDVANRLRACLRGTDSLARLGGDEFAFVLPGASREVAERVAQRVVRTVGEPFHVAGHNVRIGGSVGIAMLADADGDVAALFKQADIAMYSAKYKRGSYAFFRRGQEREVQTRLTLETELARAIERDELHLVYQPRVDLHNGYCDSVEALVRWDHPQRGTIAPGEFIPIAEETGLIVHLGDWVVHQACAQLHRWREAGLEVRMAVNISLREINDAQLAVRLRRALGEHRIDGRWMELEVTESAAMTDPEASGKTLRALHEMGFLLSIDDFGTGYSSLNQLKQLPADFLKIDQSFVAGIGSGDPEGAVDEGIVRVVVALAKSLGIEVIAEGVERGEQVHFLVAEGCRYAQGYHFARPMPAADLLEMLADRPRLTGAAVQ